MAVLVGPVRREDVYGRCRRIRAGKPVKRADLVALAGLVALTLIAQPHLLQRDTLISLDSASQYYPWYAFLGQSLRSGHIPGWNPATFAGAPFAANPLSGWTYLPAMLFFGLLPLDAAAKSYLIFHPLLAAWSTFAFGRAIGLTRLGAFVAGLAYANSGFLQVQNVCCFAFASVYARLPITLVGAEFALRAKTMSARAAWWGLAALGISQIAAAWLGQGAYYAALIVGGYIGYRTLLAPATFERRDVGSRIRRMLAHEAVVFLSGVALAAAGLLPRIEFNALSNLAGGYMGAESRVGGLRPEQWTFLAMPGVWYVGVSVLLLAAAAPIIVRGRLGAPLVYLGASSVIALVLTDTFETPLDWLLYHVLPGFSELDPHAPERILTVAYLGPALLAGVTISAVRKHDWSGIVRGGYAIAVVLLITLDLAAAGAWARSSRTQKGTLDGIDALTPVDLATYYHASGAAEFLQQQAVQSSSRFVGYAPDVDGHSVAYTVRFLDPDTADLEVNNHALPLGLEDAQGYDASHLRRYDAFVATLNGQTQDYHDAEVFSGGLSSPLLDLLNVRYVIAPARSDGLDAGALERFGTTVYADASVRIFENASAFPRAWIVHAATQVAPDKIVATIADGQVDAYQTALLEEPPPPLDIPADASLDQAAVTSYEPDRLSIRTSTASTGLLVLSEIYYPAWNAYVDGQPRQLYVADRALRAVSVPPGEHTVELRFESEALAMGILISGTALVLLAFCCASALVAHRDHLLNSRT